MIRLEMKKPPYDINREPAKISTILSGNIDKYEYLTGEEILPSNKKQIIEEAKFALLSFRKSFPNTNKNN